MKRLILSVLAVGIMAAGCSSVSGLGPSYKDGEAFAQGEIAQGNPLLGDAQAECASLVAQGSVPDSDNQAQWTSGCEAALANAKFIGGSGTGSGTG